MGGGESGAREPEGGEGKGKGGGRGWAVRKTAVYLPPAGSGQQRTKWADRWRPVLGHVSAATRGKAWGGAVFSTVRIPAWVPQSPKPSTDICPSSPRGRVRESSGWAGARAAFAIGPKAGQRPGKWEQHAGRERGPQGAESAPPSRRRFSLPRLSPGAPATGKVRGAGAGLRPPPICSANRVLGPPLGRGGTGLPWRGAARRSIAWQLRGCSRSSSGGRRSAAPAPASAGTALPPGAVDRGHSAAVARGSGAAGARGLQAEGCWSLSRARRGSGAPETDRAGMLESVLRRPRRGHGCWVLGGFYLLSSEGLGRQAPDRPPAGSQSFTPLLCCASQHSGRAPKKETLEEWK
ncbi:uncharacterized protein [Eschrichtius robustus]|uniref:uncharacterized protein n=1 Tax=Eschrichtius robustus TaxID=9764 RepID=UPI0035BED8C5